MEDCLEEKITAVAVTNFDGENHISERSYNGKGEITLDNDTSYTGDFKNGYFDGNGTFRWSDGVEYTGGFVNGHIKGSGEYSWPDESKYKGEVFYGKRHGNGEFDGSSNQHYEGEWRNGKRHGTGTMYYNAERTIFYSGGWKANRRHGFGTMTYQSGNMYEGEWEHDLKCGEGVMTWLDKGEVHLGRWEFDLPNGHGEHIWTDAPGKSFQRQMCNMYRGDWKDGLREGRGCFFYANGSQYVGDWEADMKQGQGKYIGPDGKIQFGVFENNRMIVQQDSSALLDRKKSDVSSIVSSTSSSKQSNQQPARETDAVSAQFSMNVCDVLYSYPALPNKASYAQQTLDIQRLVLRYNTAVRNLLKKYTNASVAFRSIMSNPKYKKDISHSSLRPPASWSTLQLLFFNRRAIHEKFFTISMQQLLQFARECDLIGPTLTAYDVCQCVRAMHLEHSRVAEETRKEHARAAAQLAMLPPPPVPEIDTKAPRSGAGSVTSKRSNSIRSGRSSRVGGISARKSSSAQSAGAEGGGDDDASTSSSVNSARRSQSIRSSKKNSVKHQEDLDGAALSALLEEENDGAEQETEDGGAEEEKGGEGSPVGGEDNVVVSADVEEDQGTEETSSSAFDVPLLPLLLDQSFEPTEYEDMLFPLREREFVELMVRVIAEASCRKQGGVSGSGLFDNIYKVFAEVVEPLASESSSPSVFVSVLYAESVQTALRRRASQMRALWDQVMEIARVGSDESEKRVPQVKHIIKLMLALRGTAIEEDCTVLTVMEAVGKKGNNDDVSSLDLFVTFDDFTEMFCRLVVSSLWMFSPEQNETESVRGGNSSPKQMDRMSEASTSQPTLQRQSSSRSPVSIIETALSKRLSEWLKLI